MKSSYRSTLRVGHQNRDAICYLDPKQHVGLAGNNAISFERRFGNRIFALQDADEPRMNLPQRDERRKGALATGYSFDESATITIDGLTFIRRRKAKVKLSATIGIGNAATACAEPMTKARKSTQIGSSKNFWLGNSSLTFGADEGRHPSF